MRCNTCCGTGGVIGNNLKPEQCPTCFGKGKIEEKFYILIYQGETDGDILSERLTKEKIEEKTEDMSVDDYMIIEDAKIVKGFNQKSFNF